MFSWLKRPTPEPIVEVDQLDLLIDELNGNLTILGIKARASANTTWQEFHKMNTEVLILLTDAEIDRRNLR